MGVEHGRHQIDFVLIMEKGEIASMNGNRGFDCLIKGDIKNTLQFSPSEKEYISFLLPIGGVLSSCVCERGRCGISILLSYGMSHLGIFIRVVLDLENYPHLMYSLSTHLLRKAKRLLLLMRSSNC